MREQISLNGVRLRLVSGAAASVVSAETALLFEQVGDCFSARYRGGSILDGYLIGKPNQDGSVEFRYVQADREGNLDTGVSTGSIMTILGL